LNIISQKGLKIYHTTLCYCQRKKIASDKTSNARGNVSLSHALTTFINNCWYMWF